MNEPITQAPTVAHHDHERHWSGAFPARPPTPAAGSSEFPAPPVDTFCQRIGVAYVDVNSITPGYSVLPLTRAMWKVLLRDRTDDHLVNEECRPSVADLSRPSAR